MIVERKLRVLSALRGEGTILGYKVGLDLVGLSRQPLIYANLGLME